MQTALKPDGQNLVIPLLFQNGCSQSLLFFLPLLKGNKDSGNKIGERAEGKVNHGLCSWATHRTSFVIMQNPKPGRGLLVIFYQSYAAVTELYHTEISTAAVSYRKTIKKSEY